MAPTGDNSDLAMPDDIFYDQMYQAMGGSSDGAIESTVIRMMIWMT